MKKNSQVTMPAQRPFTITNMSALVLKVSPALNQREGDEEPYSYHTKDEFTSLINGRCSTDTRYNDHEQNYHYVTNSRELRFESPHAKYGFTLYKFGNQVTYSTSSPDARVDAFPWIFDDFLAITELSMRKPSAATDRVTEETYVRGEVQVNDRVFQYSSSEPVQPSPQIKASQVVIAPADKFSLLSNVNIYFSGCVVYKEFPPGQIEKVDRHGWGNPTLGSDYYLSPDKSYPPGVSTLTIKDGFSEATAVVEFDHDTAKKQVTITIKSFTSKLCDIRDVDLNDTRFPNAICIAL